MIQYEKSFDAFHTNKANLYRVIRIGKHPTDRDYRTEVPIPVTSTLRKEFPQLVHAGAIAADGNVQVIVRGERNAAPKKFKEATGVFFAEPEFFQMFDFPLSDRLSYRHPDCVVFYAPVAGAICLPHPDRSLVLCGYNRWVPGHCLADGRLHGYQGGAGQPGEESQV